MTQRSTSRSVVVVGGGVIGLAAARELALRGHAVTAIERASPAGEATWAAAGMLAPLAEAEAPGPFLDLGTRSLEQWPAWARAVGDESGHDPGFRRCGKLMVAFSAGSAERLRERARVLAQAGHAARWLDAAEALRHEPGLAPDAAGALHLASDALVDNRRLGEALYVAARACGVGVRRAAVRGLRVARGAVVGVELDDGEALPADTVVVAAGAWSGELEGLPRPLPVRPVRGQMLALAVAGATAQPRGLVGGPGVYLVPRHSTAGPRVLVGATEERVGFRRGTDDDAIARLRSAAQRTVPALRDATEVERWSGFRPGTPDGLPVLGPDPDLTGLVWATGHYRNGILLAPLTAELVADTLDGEAAGLEAFRADRFDGAPVG